MLNQVFDKFIEWDEIAQKNKAEPFEKIISHYRDLTFGAPPEKAGIYTGFDSTMTFEWDERRSTLQIGSAILSRDDVVHFKKLLPLLPELKEELVKKIKAKQAQDEMFK